MVKTSTRRQRVRRSIILVSMLLFPVILNYFSPHTIIVGASLGIVNGSLIMFTLLFLSALFFGRLWCAWGCPGAGLQEMLFSINNEPARGGRLNWIKWGIWVPWVGLIAYTAITAGGYRSIDFFHLTDNGISVTKLHNFIIYYVVVGTFLALSLWLGRRASCHYICWMAPFMILGRAIRNLFKWPALRLEAEPTKCGACRLCTKTCPMSLPVDEMVKQQAMENGECILCGICIDNCSRHAIRYTFRGG